MQKLKNNLESFLGDIEDIIINSREDNVSLLDGGLSSCIFWAYLSNYRSKDYSNLAESKIELALDQIKQKTINSNFFNGLAGFGWSFNHLCEQNILNENPNRFLSELDELLIKTALVQ